MWETRGDGNADRHRHTLGRRTHHPTQAHICEETMGDKGRGGEKGRQDPGKAGTPIQQAHKTGRQDLGKADTPSHKGTHVGRQWETRRDKRGGKGRQDFGKADHTIQHRGGHLQKAVRTPNSTLFGEKSLGAVAPCAFLDQIHHFFSGQNQVILKG